MGDNISAKRLARVLWRAKAHYPVSDSFEHDWLPGTSWWSSQQEHVCRWLEELNGPGAYGRKGFDSNARDFYQRFKCAAGLLWVAEAVGVDEDLVREAAEAAAAEAGAGKLPATQCAAIRRVIPWDVVADKVRKRRWLWLV